ncbi:MAG: ATP-binding protein [Pseudomonadota bacterium]
MKKKTHLLIVDDDDYIRHMMQEIFTAHGYEVSLADCGAVAMEIVERRKPDIAFIDIVLPDTWGTELIQHFKKIHPGLLCIVVTGDPSLDSALDALHYGAEAFFQKPLKMDEVIARLGGLAEKKHLQDEIARLNELPKVILDCINESIAIIDTSDYSIISANKVFQEETGLTENELIGRTCYAVTHNLSSPCNDPRHLCPLKKALSNGSHATSEHIHVNKDGKSCYVEVSVSPVKNKAGNIASVIHATRDITERKELELSLEQERKLLQDANAQLEKAISDLKQTQSQIVQQEKMASIGQLAAGVAHEINNPMGFISSNLSSLAKYIAKMTEFIALQDRFIAEQSNETTLQELDKEKKKMKIDFLLDDIPALIEESMDGAKRVKNIVQNLKSFSRIDNNEISPVNINECLDTTLNIVWNELKYKATVAKDYGTLPFITGSAQQLNQVFMNVLINAAQSIEKSGEIRIRTWHENSSVLISITDTGCGISPKHLSHIFEPFFTTKDVGKGTGLGMSITYDIIKKHRGDLTVESVVGVGTTFTISLPQSDDPEAHQA